MINLTLVYSQEKFVLSTDSVEMFSLRFNDLVQAREYTKVFVSSFPDWRVDECFDLETNFNQDRQAREARNFRL